jgi:heat shock protein HspQ
MPGFHPYGTTLDLEIGKYLRRSSLLFLGCVVDVGDPNLGITEDMLRTFPSVISAKDTPKKQNHKLVHKKTTL